MKDNSDNLDKPYNPKEVEDKIYAIWEKSGFFNPDNLPARHKKPFCITVPPPNITGSLHMGHALNATIQDILIRKKRMEGLKTLWLPGTDHAGIATQNVVEKELKKQSISRHNLGREKFLEHVWEWKEKYGHIILDQFKKLGSSMDWSRLRFTMDPEYQKTVKEAFLHYYKKGWIYRGERTINWCTRCATSLSDLEIEYKEERANFYYIKYGTLTLGTVRPETKLGDTALAVSPKDKRYQKYIGKEIAIQSIDPSTPREQPPKLKNIKIKVVEDIAVDPQFGTGVIKVTPAHDLTDFEIFQRHPGLPIIKVIGENGRMTKEAGVRYEGLKVAEARKQITEDLTKLGLMEKIEDYTHKIAICYRCGTVIEPLLSNQWFLKMKKLAEYAIKAVKSGKVKFHPKRWEKIYFDWLKNIRDWTISRQIWWGHKIPLEETNDILDTWFSSALWPFAALQNKNGDFEKFYPTQILSTARDIINLWVARMIFSGLEFTEKTPFKNVIIHATILTKDGKRMSKSLGTGLDPINLINLYGADAVRFGLIWQAMKNQDIHWAEESLVAGKKLLNKIWNAARFVLKQNENQKLIKPRSLTSEDKKILKKLNDIVKNTDKNIKNYNFGAALHDLYNFFWHDFCDQYLESSKKQMTDEKLKTNTRIILMRALIVSLKLFHPFVPFITEEIWSKLPIKNKKLLMIEQWPKKLF